MSVIIDVGGQDGSAIAIPYSQDLSANVYAIESDPQWVGHLKSYQRPNLHVFCMRLGNSEDERERQTQTIAVPVKRLDTFIREQQLAAIDLLNIGKGCDLQILQGAGDALRAIRRIQLTLSGATKPEFLEYLSDRGFVLVRSAADTSGLENLEWIRVQRYPFAQAGSSDFEVQIPNVGRLNMPKRDHVGQLLERGSFEGSEQAFLWLYLRSGDTFFDCGTHAGLFSAIAAQQVGQLGKVVGFDPNPICFDLYQQNLKRLGYQNWLALKVGLSDRDGTAALRLGKSGMSAFSTFAAGEIEPIGAETLQVTQRSLDSVIQELQISQVALAKLDVEGWEAFVLNGAKQSIASGIFPVWMIEFTEINAIAAGSSTSELRSLIENLGYALCRFDLTQLRLIPEPPRVQYRYDNLFAVLDLEAVNQRLQTADATVVTLAKDLIRQWDTAIQRDEFVHLSAYWRSRYEQLRQTQRQGEQSPNETLQARNQQLEQQKAHLEAELADLSTGKAALRKLLKGSLRRLGLYRFAYRHHRIFVPIYNFFSGDRWQPATLKNSPTDR